MSFWDTFKKSLGGDKDAMQKIVDTLSPWNIAKRNIQNNTKRVLGAAKEVAEIAQPITKPVGQALGYLGKGALAPFQAFGIQPGASPAGGILKAGAQIGASRAAAQLETNYGIKLNDSLRDGMAEYAAQTAAEAAIPFDPMLWVSAQAEEKVFSPLIKRPISTAALLTDPNSPLYENDAYGKGLQLSDLQTAYQRTGNQYEIIDGKEVLVSPGVSLGVALTKSYLNPFHVTGISDAILEDGGIDIDRVNLWDDQDVQSNFTDNTTGRWMTGFTDALVGNVAIVGAVNKSISAMKAAARAAGFNTKLNVYDGDAINKLEKLADDHLSGQSQTVFGQDIVNLAGTKDIVLINKILKPHSNNPRLASLIKETEDPAFVRDLLLADKGYAPAINRLMTAQKADDLWYLSNASDEIFADFAKNGKYRSYNAQAKERWSQAFDDAIAKNPESQRIFDAFMRDQFDAQTGKFIPEPRVLGTTYKPAEPIVGKDVFIKGREFKQRFGAATEVRDYSNIGGVAQTLIGGGRRGDAVTALIKFTGGKLPRGIISHSGLRPQDMVEELNAWLDDIPLFSKGTNTINLADGTVVKAADYRRNIIDKALMLKTDGEREVFFKAMTKEVGVDVMGTMGVGRVRAQQFVDDFMDDLNKYHGDLKRDSYAMDPSGVRTVIDPQTQRQLVNATPLLPLGKIVREAKRIQGSFDPTNNTFTDAGRTIFELGNKTFSFAQLVRPAYVPKNSIFEPLNAAIMSQGSKVLFDGAETFAKNTIFNNKNRFNQVVNKANIKSAARRRALKQEYAQYSEQYEKAVDLVDRSTAEWVEFFINPSSRSPVVKAEYADIVKSELSAAERLIDKLETKMRNRAREFGVEREQVPTLYGLVRRTQYLKTLNDPRIAGDIRAAELAITKAAGDINTLAPDLNNLNKNIKTAYDDIDKLLVDMGPTRKKLADEFSVVDNARIRRRGRQEPDGYVMSNGQVIKIPRLESENNLGTSYKAEISNRHTREMEILGDKTFAKGIQMLGRRSPNRITDVTDPLYFDELAYTVNNFMRGDVLVDQILAGRTRNEIIENWGLKRGGRSYAEEFGRDASDIIDMIDDQISYVNRYLPTLEAKAAAAAGEVRGNQLAQLLGDKLDRLTPINPLENKYATPIEQSKDFLDAIDRASSKAWTLLGAPENAIRWAWGSVELKARTVEKLEMLAAQGYSIDVSTINSVRQAAAVEMVKEAEKTFYSIRRQNRGLYAARTVLSFPAASASGIYRYTRFAAKAPQRIAGFLNSYYGLFNTFGVDKYGNPVEDPFDAEYLLVPGTKELGLNKGRGVMVGTRAANFIANFAGPSYLMPSSLGAVVALKPGNDKIIRDAINTFFGKVPGYSYEELFPYGLEPDLAKQAKQTFTPAWLRNFMLYVAGDDSKKDWVDSYTSEWNYQMALYEMGIGKAPTEEMIVKQTKKKFREKFLWQFASPLGTAAVVDNRPDSIFSTYFRAAVDKYKGMGLSDREAKKRAEDDLNARVSVTGKKVEFPMDRLYFGSKRKPKAAYITPTVEGYKRVWEEFSGLAKDLAVKDKNLVGLITADLRGADTDANIARVLNRPGTTLPDGTVLNLPLKSVADVEKDIEVSRVWKAYGDYKRQLNELAKKQQYASYSSVPELRDALKAYALQLGQFSENWLFEYNQRESKDISYQYAWGLTKIVKDNKFMEKHGNTQFWTHAEAIMRYRDDYVKLYKDAPTGTKGIVQNAWRDYVNSVLDVVDPKLADILDRYFENDNLTEVNID
jgi:hypothetical protein